MKKQTIALWMVLGGLFIGAAVLVNIMPDKRGVPYSSSSAAPDGTKAAYLLLSELGFKVERKTRKEYSGEGVVIALGPEYLPGYAESDALIFEDDVRFTNANIRDNAVEFVELMWPYRNVPIVFEEYGRGSLPKMTGTEDEITLWAVMPVWLKVILLNLACAAFYIMFFYKQRFGATLAPEDFSGRQPLESVEAMAGALEKARAYRDCADFYYKYRARSGDQWDKQGKFRQRLGTIRTEREALVFVAEIDRQIKEYHQ